MTAASAQHLTGVGVPDQAAIMVQGDWTNAGTNARFTEEIHAGSSLQWLKPQDVTKRRIRTSRSDPSPLVVFSRRSSRLNRRALKIA